MGGVGLELGTELGDEVVHGARGAVVARPPHRVEDLLPAEHAPTGAGQRRQDLELGAGELHPLAAAAHLHPVEIERHLAEPDRAAGGGGAPPQQRAHAGQQLAHRERLGDVVVGAEVEPQDPVHLGAPRRQDQHRGVVAGPPQPAEQLVAVEAREHDVEDDQVEPSRPRQPEPLAPVGGRGHLEPLAGERHLEPHPDRGVVLHHQDPRPAHPLPSATGRTSVKVAPRPGSLSTSTRPPWARAIRSTMARPRPVPCTAEDSRSSTR